MIAIDRPLIGNAYQLLDSFNCGYTELERWVYFIDSPGSTNARAQS
jgi:hypothetical protein